MESQSDALTIRCRLRRSSDESSSPITDALGNCNRDEVKEMVCKMYQGTVDTEWNLWDGIRIQRVDTLDDNIPNKTSPNGTQQDQCQHKYETKLSFFPVRLPPSVSNSRSRPSVPSPRRTIVGSGTYTTRSVSSSSNNDFEFNLPNPNRLTVPRRIHYNIRAESPDPRINTAYRAKRRGGCTPIDCTNAAAACFVVNESILRCQKRNRQNLHPPQPQSGPLHIYFSDLVSVQKDLTSNQNSGIGVIRIQTRAHGILEVIPHTIDGRDVLVAFLQSCLPKGSIQDKLYQFTKQLQCSSSDDVSVDMQHFEARTVRKSFANESIFEKMRRRSAVFSLRMQELCICCEAAEVKENDSVTEHKSNSIMDKDDMDTSVTGNSTVDSVLTEMELSVASEDQAIASPEAIGVITCSSTEEKNVIASFASAEEDIECESNDADSAHGDSKLTEVI